MWAAVISVDITDSDSALKGLNGEVVPAVRQAPGFVTGYWIRLDETRATSFAVFDTEDQARAQAPPLGATPHGVTVTSVDFGEVLAKA